MSVAEPPDLDVRASEPPDPDQPRPEPKPRPVVKSASAFRTISEVSADLDVPQHVLRFWESKFPQIRPLKRGGGRRYYRPEDVDLLRRIQALLYKEGYTIRGVQRLLRESRADGPVVVDEDDDESTTATAGSEEDTAEAVQPEDHGAEISRSGLTELQRETIASVIDELETLRDMLREKG